MIAACVFCLAMGPSGDGLRDPLCSVAWIRAGPEGSGTAFVVDAERRLLVTARHVVGARARVEVIFPYRVEGEPAVERAEYLARRGELRRIGLAVDAQVIRRDDATDLAVLRAESLPPGTRSIRLGPPAVPGSDCRLVGNRGDLPTLWNHAGGVVRQSGHTAGGYFWRGRRLAEGTRVLLTDLPAAEGDSGAAVVDRTGELVGILAATLPGSVSAAIDVRELAALLGEDIPPAPPPHPTEVFGRIARAAAWLRPESTGRRSLAWLWDQDKRLLITSSTAVGSAEVVTVLFPRFREGIPVAEQDAYASGFVLRRLGLRIRGRVVARDPERDLAMVQVESVPPDGRALPLADRQPVVAARIHTISNPASGDLLWLYGRGEVVQRTVNASVARLSVGPNDSGMPVVDDDGSVVGVVTGARAGSGNLPLAVDLAGLRAFLTLYDRETTGPSVAARLSAAEARLRDWERPEDRNSDRFDRSLSADPLDVPARVSRSFVARNRKDWKAARGDLILALEHCPRTAFAWEMLAEVQFALGQNREAVESLMEACWLEPTRIGNTALLVLSRIASL